MIIRAAELLDAPAWEAMRRDLWPEGAEDHSHEIAAFFAGTLDEPQAVLAVQESSWLIAFAELSTRDDGRELAEKKVGYVEGLYVVPSFRRRGVTRKLLLAARQVLCSLAFRLGGISCTHSFLSLRQRLRLKPFCLFSPSARRGAAKTERGARSPGLLSALGRGFRRFLRLKL